MNCPSANYQAYHEYLKSQPQNIEQVGALLRMKWPKCALASKVTNLLLSPACTGRSLDQRVQFSPMVSFITIWFYSLYYPQMYTIYLGIRIVDPFTMRITGDRHYVRHHPQNSLEFLYNKRSFVTPVQPYPKGAFNAHRWLQVIH